MERIEISEQDRAQAEATISEWFDEERASTNPRSEYQMAAGFAVAIAENIARDLGDGFDVTGYQLARFQVAVARRDAILAGISA